MNSKIETILHNRAIRDQDLEHRAIRAIIFRIVLAIVVGITIISRLIN